MSKLESIKIKNYFIYFLVGFSGIFIGLQILYAIVSEMNNAYLPASKYAYICGIIACGLIIAAGISALFKAFRFEKYLFKGIKAEERQRVLEELDDEMTLSFGQNLIITHHYVLVKNNGQSGMFGLIRMEDLVACFKRPHYAGSDDMVQYDIVLSDKRFKLYVCQVKGDSAQIMEEAYMMICTLAPWVITDDYEQFLIDVRQRSKHKAYLKKIEHRKSKSEVVEDTIPGLMISASDLIQSFEEKQRAEREKHEKTSRRSRLMNMKKKLKKDEKKEQDDK